MLTPDPFLAGILQRPAFHAEAASLDAAMFTAGMMAFVDARAAVHDIAACHRLQEAGFHLNDTNVQFDRGLSGIWPQNKKKPETVVRFASSDDQSAVEDIAASCFTFSRFHLDPLVGRDQANEIKRRWAGNFFSGKRGRWMVVAERGGKVVAFLQLLSNDDAIIIDLIGVAPEHQRRGAGTGMIAFAARECAPATRMVVGTQIANTPSLRAYEGLGFRICSASHVFHYHGPLRI